MSGGLAKELMSPDQFLFLCHMSGEGSARSLVISDVADGSQSIPKALSLEKTSPTFIRVRSLPSQDDS